MIDVHFFGMTRLKLNINHIQMDAKDISSLLQEISKQYHSISVKDLKKSVIFVNGTNIIHLKVFKTKLKQGDQVHILSPAGGG